MPSNGYPDVSPEFKLKNPRGLDDFSINAIEKSVKDKLVESVGLPVVFDLIDVIREHLTKSNLPSGQCVVCLYGFQEGDKFTKTNCYHFLHSYCLARHLIASKKNYQEEQDKLPAWQRKQSKPYNPMCPVCRELIDNEVEPLISAEPPNELQNAPKFKLTTELINLQSKMADLFLHQKNRGGIIDLDADENNVISIEDEDELNERKNYINRDGNNSNNDTVSSSTDGFVNQTTRNSNNSPVPSTQNHHRFPHNRGTHRINESSNSDVTNNESTTRRNQDNHNTYAQQNRSQNRHHGGGYSNRSYNRNRRGVHNTQNHTQQPCSSNNR